MGESKSRPAEPVARLKPSPPTELTRHAWFIAEHDCAAVVALSASTLTVCGSYTRWLPSGLRVTGFRVETIANTRAAAREWLGY